MATKDFLSIQDFAVLARTTKVALLHYDKIGLLAPASRGAENKYRYYSSAQLGSINMIRVLQRLGLSLREIKRIMSERTPQNTEKLIDIQMREIDKRIDEWRHVSKFLRTLRQIIESVSNIDENAVTIQYLKGQAIVLGEKNEYGKDGNAYNALQVFYRDVAEKHPEHDFNYPVWAVFSGNQIKRGDFTLPDRYYFYNPDGQDQRPAALYAIGYARGGYGEHWELFERLLAYIGDNGFEVCGNAYEEYPLNEACITDETNYLLRLLITVRPSA